MPNTSAPATDFAALLQPDRGEPAHRVEIVDAAGLDGWLNTQPPAVRAAVAGQQFAAKPGSLAIIPSADGWQVVAALETGSWALAKLAETLPEGIYRLEGEDQPLLGWLLGQYRFDFFFNDTAPTEIYTANFVGSVRCV